MKKNLIILSCSIILLAVMFSCRNNEAQMSPIEKAEKALSEGDTAAAQELCDEITQSTDIEKLSTEELCRLSLLYVRLAETGDSNEVNTAMAATCLLKAFELDIDSATTFLDNMSNDDRNLMRFITAISEGHTLPFPTDSLDYEEIAF